MRICSLLLLIFGILLFTGVSLRRALVLRQEALCKNVRFRGWGGILGLCQWKKGRYILGNRRQFFGLFYEESYFPSSLPERTDICWLIGNSKFGLRNTGSGVYVPSLVNRALPDGSWSVVLPLPSSYSHTSRTQTPFIVILSLKSLEIKYIIGNSTADHS